MATEVCYNGRAEVTGNGAFCFLSAVESQSIIVGKAPSVCGLTSRQSPQQRRQAHGGRFVMFKKCLGGCQEVKPATLEYFHRNKNEKDGLSIRCKACSREYHQRNKEILIERAKQWQRANPKRASEIWRQSYRRNEGEVKKRVSIRAKQNPEAGRATAARRRARKLNSEGSYTAEEWLTLCDYYGNKCLACGEYKKLTADHVIPLTKGGSNDISNIQPLCGSCNSSKGQKTIDYR